MKDVKSNLMRLDRFLSTQLQVSRNEAVKLVRNKNVTVDGVAAKAPSVHINAAENVITVDGKAVTYRKYTYIMMNKPAGILSASRDRHAKTVLELLPDALLRRGLFPAGRLDKDTTGLMIITDDGEYAHNMLSPKKHVNKLYEAKLRREITETDILRFRLGLSYQGILYAPATLTRLSGSRAQIQIQEGKYHQIKRMFEATGNYVEMLKRLKIGALELDPKLEPGEARLMTAEEAKLVFEPNTR